MKALKTRGFMAANGMTAASGVWATSEPRTAAGGGPAVAMRAAPTPAMAMRVMAGWAAVLAMAASGAWGQALTGEQEGRRQALFERVFGDAVRLDAERVAKVKAGKPGERVYVDRDGDGQPEECWFIDDARRHQEKNRPILVRAIDEDGDMERLRGPDLDSDLYVADWHADGKVDVVLDYQDDDGDGDVDQMAFYFYMPSHPYFGQDVLRVWWGSDDGDDNLLWYDVDYTYYQDLCQYRCHFSGEESFVAFGLLPDAERWLTAFENPFLFYDPDGDGCSEVVLRIEGHGEEARAIRYSFDADDDAFGRRTHDYDFSITAYTETDRPLRLPPDALTSMKLRGWPTQPWLTREKACEVVVNATGFSRALLTWDEMNANTEGNVERDPYERWEGVIARGSQDFKQVGGPACGENNKRNELSMAPVSPMRLYYDPCDHRLHLVGANRGWLHVDYDFDGKVDAAYTWIDEDNDGYFDRRRIDVDADGTAEFDWAMGGGGEGEKGRKGEEGLKGVGRADVALDWNQIKGFWVPELDRTLQASQGFIDAAKVALGGGDTGTAGGGAWEPVEEFFLTKLAGWGPRTGLGAYMRKTPAGAMLYVEMVRDRLLRALKQKFGAEAAWGELEKVYAAGDYAAATYVVVNKLSERAADVLANKSSERAAGKGFGAFSRRVPIRIANDDGLTRMDWPVCVTVREIREVAPDFNPVNCAVTAPERWLGWRQVPHQVDEIDAAVGREISFMADVPKNEGATYYLYYSPEGESRPGFEARTAITADWIPPNLGWENTRVAYRTYWGHFDFFGKKLETLIYPDIGKQSYHSEVEWGIDALHVGQTCGLGGLWLYEGERETRLFNPVDEKPIAFANRLVTAGPVRAAIEVTGKNVDPERPAAAVRILAVIYDERPESEVRVRMTGVGEDAELAPGVNKLPIEKAVVDKEAGCLGAWGYQEAAIDEIGVGVVVPPDRIVSLVDGKDERRVRCRTEGGALRFWIVGDWRRGRQHPIAPTVDNWRAEMRELAGRLNRPVRVWLEVPEAAR